MTRREGHSSAEGGLETDMHQSDGSDVWRDDALNRASMAEKLTNVVKHQHEGMVISLNGDWGTGKTFFLERWKRHLEAEGFRTLYFNAWQDEFCNEPLVAILTQLSTLYDDTDLESIGHKFQVYFAPMLMQNMQSIVEKQLGLDLSTKLDQSSQLYVERTKLKARLEKELKNISDRVRKETQKPLIFIVDELDRCKPTYSINFLEKVVHVFQAPNIVFVFGINKNELLASVQSIYGNIKSEVYLRRFFQREFIMPPSNLANFSQHLIESRRLEDTFNGLGPQFRQQLDGFVAAFAAIAAKMELTLRDIEYCIRVIEDIAMNLDENPIMHPCFLAILVPLSLVNKALYKRLVEGELIGAEVADFLNQMRDDLESRTDLNQALDLAEVYLYSTYSNDTVNHNPAFQQLHLLAQGKELTNPSLLSEMTRGSSQERAQRLLKRALNLYGNYPHHEFLSVVSELTELVGR